MQRHYRCCRVDAPAKLRGSHAYDIGIERLGAAFRELGLDHVNHFARMPQ
jgi:hypothetical protein